MPLQIYTMPCGALPDFVSILVSIILSINEHLELGDGVTAVKPTNSLGEISHCDFQRCPIEERQGLISNITLTEGQTFISDVYSASNGAFQCSEKITLQCPIFHAAFPPSATIKVKTKSGDKWLDVGGDVIVSMCMCVAYFKVLLCL